MLKKPGPEPTALEIVTLEGLVRQDHLLRKIEAAIDFSFIMIEWRSFTASTTGGRRWIRH